MKLLKWQGGRQIGSNYMKMPLWYFKIGRLGTDAYIIKYEGNAHLPNHTDPVDNGRHWRLNITLGGRANFFIYKDGDYKIINRRFIWFRPDIQEHLLEASGYGCTKLSIGFVIFNKKKNKLGSLKKE